MIAVMLVCLQSSTAVVCQEYISQDILDRAHCEATIQERADMTYTILRRRFGPMVVAVSGKCRLADEAA